MSVPLVSVHVATYNQRAFIADTLDSALAQDYPNLEIVVGDDGSTDGTWEIAADYAARHPDRIVLLPHERCGIIPNWNRILRACRGEYVAILNGDDLFLPGKVQAQIDWFLADERRVLCGHDTEHFDSDTGRRRCLQSELAEQREGAGASWFVTRGCPFAAVSVMVKRSACPPHGFESRLRVCVDFMFFAETVVGGGHFGFVDGVLARYRLHVSNTMERSGAILEEDQFVSLALLEARYPKLAEACIRGRSQLYMRRGVSVLLSGGSNRDARRSLLLAAANAPFDHPKLPFWLAATALPGPARERFARWVMGRLVD